MSKSVKSYIYKGNIFNFIILTFTSLCQTAAMIIISLMLEKLMAIATTKDSKVICNSNTPLAERANMAYSGSVVTLGKAKGVVVGVGNNTEIGKIAHLLFKAKKEMTPLQKSRL